MKKVFLLISSILLAAFAVKAQTFQRKVQQPAFFMPRSALSTQQQEKLPAIESMNYQGTRAPSVKPVINQQKTEQKIKENPFQKSEVSANKITKNQDKQEKTADIKKIKQNAPVASDAQSKAENTLNENKKTQIVAKSENPENYQVVFAEIMRQHKADLADISQGKLVENPNIEAVTEAFKPQINKINDTINY